MGRAHGLCPQPDDGALRAAAQAGRSRRRLRPPSLAPPADVHALPQRVALLHPRAQGLHGVMTGHWRAPIVRHSEAVFASLSPRWVRFDSALHVPAPSRRTLSIMAFRCGHNPLTPKSAASRIMRANARARHGSARSGEVRPRLLFPRRRLTAVFGGPDDARRVPGNPRCAEGSGRGAGGITDLPNTPLIVPIVPSSTKTPGQVTFSYFLMVSRSAVFGRGPAVELWIPRPIRLTGAPLHQDRRRSRARHSASTRP